MKKLLLSLVVVGAFGASALVEAKKQDPSETCATQRGCKKCECKNNMCKSKDDCNKSKEKETKGKKPKAPKSSSTKTMSDVVASQSAPAEAAQ